MGTQQESPAEKRSAAYQLFLLVLSIYVLTVLVIETWFVSDPEIQRVLQFIDLSICIVFLGDFFWNLYAADDRRQYLKWGWIDFISSIPAIDPLRWGRLSRVIRIIRFLRAIKSFKILAQSLQRSRFESLTLIVVLVTFLAFTLCSSLILEYERHEDSPIRTAGDALWWSFLNIMNAKVSITTAVSQEGMILTIILNKVGFLLFAYFNAIIIAWLIQKRVNIKEAKTGLNASSSGSSMEAEKEGLTVRFGKRIKIPPGVHINLSGFGASVSLGPRGASVTVGKNGDFGNVSIPDTGLYPRQRLRGGKGNTSSQSKDKGASSFEVAATFRGDGAIAFSDTQDQPLPMELEKLFQNENSETVRVWMEPL